MFLFLKKYTSFKKIYYLVCQENSIVWDVAFYRVISHYIDYTSMFTTTCNIYKLQVKTFTREMSLAPAGTN